MRVLRQHNLALDLVAAPYALRPSAPKSWTAGAMGAMAARFWQFALCQVQCSSANESDTEHTLSRFIRSL